MKVYISGKITGDDEYEKKFKKWELILKAQGFQVFNPTCIPAIFDYDQYMDLDLAALKMCDAIFLMNDWTESNGAKKEAFVALNNGLKIFTEATWTEKIRPEI